VDGDGTPRRWASGNVAADPIVHGELVPLLEDEDGGSSELLLVDAIWKVVFGVLGM